MVLSLWCAPPPLWSKEMFVSRSTESIFGSDRRTGENRSRARAGITGLAPQYMGKRLLSWSWDSVFLLFVQVRFRIIAEHTFYAVKSWNGYKIFSWSKIGLWFTIIGKGFDHTMVFVSIWWVSRGVLQIVVVNVFGFRLNIDVLLLK